MILSSSPSNSCCAKQLLTVAIALSIVPPLAADDTDVSSVEEYVAAISENVSSIYSLDCIFTIQFGDDTELAKWRFARQGVMWHRTEISLEDNGAVERQGGLCYDGEYVYRMIVRKLDEGSEKWRHIEVQDGTQEPPTHVFPDAMMGARLSNMGCSIVDAWETVTPELTRAGGETRLLATNVPSQLTDTIGMSFDIEYVTDESRGLLPFSIRIWESGKDPDAWFQHWVVDEWSKFTDASSGTDRWFPVRGTLLQPGDAPGIRVSVESVAINTELPLSLFRPEDAPPGTALTNATSEGVRGAVAIIGDDRPVDKVVDQVLKDTQGIDVAAGRPDLRNWVLLINGVVLAGLIIFLGIRRWKRSATP